MSEAELVCAITVNWNQADSTLETLSSLQTQRYPNLVTIVVDNASTDQSAAFARITQAYPSVRTIASRENLGYGGGCNLGIEAALELGADYVMILNNDLRLDPNAVGELVSALRGDPASGAACPVIYLASAPDTVYFAGGTIDRRHGMLPKIDREGERVASPLDGPARETGWLAGTAIMTRRSALQAAGPMDPSYFMYWEDVDWSLRLRRAGYRLLVVPKARAWHSVNASGTGATSLSYYWERNRLLVVERWGGWRTKFLTRIKVLARLGLWRLFPGSLSDTARVRQEAYRDYLRRAFGRRGGVRPAS